MFNISGRRQTLSKSVSDHQISARRHEFEHPLCNQIADEIAANIDMARVLAADRVF
jgi:hypothetical protein